MRIIFVAILCFLLSGTSWAQTATPAPDKAKSAFPQFTPRVHKEGDSSLPYQLLIPQDYAPGKAFPLIVWLHGSGEKGNNNTAQVPGILKTFLADPNTPAFVLLPQCPDKLAWHSTGINKAAEVAESSRMLLASIAEVQKEFKLDDRRIYLGGFSMGAYGVWELIMRYPGVFAAAFPVAGSPGVRTDYEPLVKDLPIWAFHGDKDSMSPVAELRKTVAALKALGSPIKYTEYAGGSHECARALADPQLLPWILAQKRKDPVDFTLAKVPDGATMMIKALANGTHGTWTAAVQHTSHGAARLPIDGTRYRLKAAPKADPAVAELLAKIGKGEVTGTYQVTGTIEHEDYLWLAVEQITVQK